MTFLPSILSLLVAQGQTAHDARITVDVAHPTHAVNPMFYGLMTEEINHAYEGGLNNQLLENPSFRADKNSLRPWKSAGAEPTRTDEGGRPTITLSPGSGLENGGFWGIPLTHSSDLRVEVKGRSAHGYVVVGLRDRAGRVLSSRKVNLGQRWSTKEVNLGYLSAPAGVGYTFFIDAKGASSTDLQWVGLYGPAYHNRKVGSRPDLMRAMIGMKPSFLRLPGGNYLEGNTLADYYPWKTTLVPPSERPGHQCPWGYWSNDTMGLMEYLHWCEDMHAEPVLAVYAGYALNGTSVRGDALKPFVQDALDEIEFVSGPVTSKWGAKRAQMGHPKPFPLHYVEVGNEDNFDPAPGGYDKRFEAFFTAIKAQHPRLQIIATAPVHSVRPDVIDDHYYRTGAAMARDWQHYDRYDRTAPKIFVGEWASTEGSPTPNMRAALGDAAWLIGLERNSDVVVMESYAPLMVNVNRGASQWGTNLIGYDALNSFLSPSYHVQALFAQNSGTHVVPVKVDQPEPEKHDVSAGKVGISTWETVSEFKDIQLIVHGQGVDTSKWAQVGGKWTFDQGLIRQESMSTNLRALTGNVSDKDYTLELKARRVSGREGFMLVFAYKDESNFAQWNIGGWGNSRSAVQIYGDDYLETSRTRDTVEEGRWYDLKLVVHNAEATGYINGRQAMHVSLRQGGMKPVYAGATTDAATGDVILKLVNFSGAAARVNVNLTGLHRVKDTARAIILKGDPNDVNSLAAPNKIAPKAETWRGIAPRFQHELAPNSVTIVRVRRR